jgi:hypothetical protein
MYTLVGRQGVCKYSRQRYEYRGEEAVEEAEEGGDDSEAVGIQQNLTSLGRIIGTKRGHDVPIISNRLSISIGLTGSEIEIRKPSHCRSTSP